MRLVIPKKCTKNLLIKLNCQKISKPIGGNALHYEKVLLFNMEKIGRTAELLITV